MARLAIIGGAGYVGLSYAVALADLGHDVVGLDLDPRKVNQLSQGRSPIFEPGLDALLSRGLESGRLRFTTEYSDAVPDAEFVFICVGTPMSDSGGVSMVHVEAAARGLALHARGHTTVVNKSTMPIGSSHFVARLLDKHAPPHASFTVVSNPEFLKEGSALHDIFHPDRIVLGCDDPVAAAQVAALYTQLGAAIVVTDPRSAEMIKYASNAFLATKISFINEIALVCERLGGNIDLVAQGIGLDSRIGSRFLQAGAGFGGSCFPKDVRALASMARDVGLDSPLLDSVLAVNTTMRRFVVDKIRARIGDLTNSTIAVLGLTFKPDTDDIREAPSLDIIEELLTSGASVRASDPMAVSRVRPIFPSVDFAEDPYAVAAGADVVVMMTEWEEYCAMDLARLARAMRGCLLIDARNALPPAAVTSAGLLYEGIGRPTETPAVVYESGRTPFPAELVYGQQLTA